MSMFGGMASPSLADIAAVTRNNDGNNGGFGDGNGWWVLIILFAIFGGWGNGGYGAGNGGAQGALTRGELCQDMNFSDLQSGVRGISQGICDSTFALNNTITNGFTNMGNAVCNLGYTMAEQFHSAEVANMQGNFGLQQAINNGTVSAMRNTDALSRQIAECCCDNRAALADIKYTMATDSCAINNAVHMTGDAIIQNQNQGFQMLNQTIKDGFCNLEMREMQRENQNLRDRLNTCDRDSALANQATYLLNQLNPQPRPAYVVQNPNCCSALPVQIQSSCGCGGNTGCCGNSFVA